MRGFLARKTGIKWPEIDQFIDGFVTCFFGAFQGRQDHQTIVPASMESEKTRSSPSARNSAPLTDHCHIAATEHNCWRFKRSKSSRKSTIKKTDREDASTTKSEDLSIEKCDIPNLWAVQLSRKLSRNFGQYSTLLHFHAIT